MNRDQLLERVLPYLKAVVAGDVSDDAEIAFATPDGPLLRPFVGRLVVAYIIDEGDHFALIQPRDLVAHGLTADELHARAVTNLAALADDQGIKIHSTTECLAVTFNGNLEATLMLVPAVWERVAARYGRTLVVAVPARDVLAVARGTREVQGIRDVVERIWPDGDHLLTRELFALDGDRWRPYAAD